jgi:hypothetical protein
MIWSMEERARVLRFLTPQAGLVVRAQQAREQARLTVTRAQQTVARARRTVARSIDACIAHDMSRRRR